MGQDGEMISETQNDDKVKLSTKSPTPVSPTIAANGYLANGEDASLLKKSTPGKRKYKKKMININIYSIHSLISSRIVNKVATSMSCHQTVFRLELTFVYFVSDCAAIAYLTNERMYICVCLAMRQAIRRQS